MGIFYYLRLLLIYRDLNVIIIYHMIKTDKEYIFHSLCYLYPEMQ